MTDRDVRERCAEIADSYVGDPVEIKHPHDWARHGERMSAIRIAKKIRALDLPLTSAEDGPQIMHLAALAEHIAGLDSGSKDAAAIRWAIGRLRALTSAREVTDEMVEAGAERAHEIDRLNTPSFGRGLPKWDKELPEYRAAACAKTRAILQAALASAPQPGPTKLHFDDAALREKIMALPDEEHGAGVPLEGFPPRFFIDHGMIHDRVTGRHVTTAPDDETWNGGTISDAVNLLNELAALSPAPSPQATGVTRQTKVLTWAIDTFGPIARDPVERSARLIEEAAELVQAAGLPQDAVTRIVERAYSRPPGQIGQEIGGVAMTLEAFAENAMFSVEEEAAREFARITSRSKADWQRKHAEKIEAGTADTAILREG